MTAGLQPIVCPQCGAKDVSVFDSWGKCPYCGVSFVIPHDPASSGEEKKCGLIDDLFQNKQTSLESFKTVNRIASEVTRDDFVRAVYMKLARERAPLAVFDQDVKRIAVKEKQILTNMISTDLSFSASIGYDREEAYIDTQTSVENRVHYNNQGERSGYSVSTREVPVTKFRTVIDWQVFQGNRPGKSVVILDNLTGEYEDSDYVLNRVFNVKPESVSAVSPEEAASLVITAKARQAAVSKHKENLQSIIEEALPGDHYRDLDFQASVTDSTSALHLAEAWEGRVELNGKTYTEKAFAFGGAECYGDPVESENTPALIAERKQKAVSEEVRETVKMPAIVSILVSALAILLGIIFANVCTEGEGVPVPLGVIQCVVFAVGLFFGIRCVRLNSAQLKQAPVRLLEETRRSYLDYLKNLWSALNQKFFSLGFPPITDELKDLENNAETEIAAAVQGKKIAKGRLVTTCIVLMVIAAVLAVSSLVCLADPSTVNVE